jgi:kynureninase
MRFEPDESFARALDADDPLRHYRDQFLLPRRADGRPALYFCGHSLGLQPKAARDFVGQELDAWARLGVDAHFHSKNPWYSYHENFRDVGARLVGAQPGEVVFMNSLTVNLHLLMMTFYLPTPARHRILMDAPAFPSDLYAMQSQVRHHGLTPAESLLLVGPRDGEQAVRGDDIEALLAEHGDEIVVVLLGAVNFLSGQYFDVPRLAEAAHRRGCVFALDLAHAAGNVVLHLHDWQVDWAVWCGYKYLNGGPGSVAGCFVHEKHGRDVALPRLAGWWGNDPATRFQMRTQTDFVPRAGADGWQISNPPILAMAPLLASLALFDEAGMPALREKSERLTGYLDYLLRRLPAGRFEVVTPADPAHRGCQLSLLVHDRPHELTSVLQAEGVVCDFREPNVLRAAPVPLYNTFHEVWAFADVLRRWATSQAKDQAEK